MSRAFRHHARPHPARPGRAIVTLLLCAAAAIVFVAPAARAAGWEVVEEHWYVLELQGAKAGHTSIVTQFDGERYRTITESRMRFRRADAVAAIEMSSTFIESEDAEPIELAFDQRMSQQTISSSWRFSIDGVTVTTSKGERETTKLQPAPQGVWLTPRAAHRYFNERREAGAQTISYRTIDPENGLTPVSVTMVRQGEGVHEIGGRSLPVTIWETSTDVLPLPMRETYSSDGHLVRQELEVAGLGTIVTRVADRAEARAVGEGPPPELLVSTFVKLERPLRDSMNLTELRLELHMKEGPMPGLPSAGAQRVEAGESPSTALLSIDVDDGLPAEPAELESAAYLEATAMVDADDALVEKLAARAVRRAPEGETWQRAELLRRTVHRHITRKGLETAFANASETARTRTGDCSEHAVLLCAMMRAEEIPARVATGLVYVDEFAGARGIFAWHMWTQALIDGKWYDFDATLPRRYHAGHVLVGTSSLADSGANAELSNLLLLMGNLEIEVLEASYE